ncbi:MAG: hypothetical protein HQM11_12675 [SAR324 cluster bacterium]|nr:hypothetical protein [SAR324 cluster bacterium]
MSFHDFIAFQANPDFRRFMVLKNNCLITVLLLVLLPATILAQAPEILSVNLAAENYFESPDITAKIIVTNVKNITEIHVNGKAKEIAPAKTFFFEVPLILRHGENQLIIDAMDESGVKAQKIYLLHFGSTAEVAQWREEKETEVRERLFFLVDLRLRYDDNPLLVPQSESRTHGTNEATSAVFADVMARFQPTVWSLGSTLVTPEVSYRFQSQKNSTSVAGGYLFHWLSGTLNWRMGEHQINTSYHNVTLLTETAADGWKSMAVMNIGEVADVWFHSARVQSRPFFMYINQNFNDDLETIKEENNQGNDLDGVKWIGGYGLNYFITPDRQQILGQLVYTNSDTRLDYEDFSGIGVVLNYRILIGERIEVTLEEHHEQNRYQATYPISEHPRHDQYNQITSGFRYLLAENTHVKLNLVRYTNDSNINLFDYVRLVADIGISTNF